jgi:hypothetical protein
VSITKNSKMDEDDHVDMTNMYKHVSNNGESPPSYSDSIDSDNITECNDDLSIEDLCYNMSSSYVSSAKYVWLTIEVDKNGDGEPEIHTYNTLEKAYRAMEMSYYTDWLGNGYVDTHSIFAIPSYTELLEESTRVANNTRFDIYINNNLTFIAYIIKREVK